MQNIRLLRDVCCVIAGGVIALGVSSLLHVERPGASVRKPVGVAPGSSADEKEPLRLDAPALRAERSGNGEDADYGRLADALAEADQDRREEALRHLAEELTGRNIADALEAGGRIPDGNDKVAFLRAVFAMWAKSDAPGALAQAQTYPAGRLRSEARAAVLGVWGAREPRAALNWMEGSLRGPAKQEAMITIASHWAGSNPEAAGAWFLSTGSASEAVLGGIVTAWADLDPRRCADWVEAIQEPELLQNARYALVAAWVEQNPEHAAEYLTPLLATPEADRLAEALVNRWGADDPSATARWIANIPAGPLRADAASTLATIWAASDIERATAWVAQITEPEMRSGVLESIAQTWGATEPAKALAWLTALPPDLSRSRATRAAFASWAATNPSGLDSWISTQPSGSLVKQARASLRAVRAGEAASPGDTSQ